MKEILAASAIGIGAVFTRQADVTNAYTEQPHRVVVERTFQPLESGLPDNTGFDISQLDPSEYPLSGRVFTALVCLTFIAGAARMLREADKLKSDSDIRLTGKALAVSMAVTSLWVLLETLTDIPLH